MVIGGTKWADQYKIIIAHYDKHGRMVRKRSAER
jgi:hypothetical protein